MENQDYSLQQGDKSNQSTGNNSVSSSPSSYWDDYIPASDWEEDAVSPVNADEETREDVAEMPVAEISAEPEEKNDKVDAEEVPATAAVTSADVEGIYEAINSVFEKVEKFQDIIKIQNKTIDRFSKGIVLESRKPLLMELCDLYETVKFGIEEDDKAVSERFPAEERCKILRAKLDELMQFIQCTLEDNQVEIKNHPNGTDQLAPYQTVTGREATDDIYRFSNFDSETDAIYVTDRCGFVVKTTEVNEAGTCKVIDHVLRPEEVTKIVLK